MPSEALRAFYFSTPMREGVLCWYPFKKDTVTLDLSGGALTELLKKRCTCVVDAPSRTGERVDYIVAIDPEDFSIDALKAFKAILSPHGRLLLAYENPFALRYWSGKRSPYTGTPYASLLSQERRPGKAEFQIRLRRAGFEGQKWYYPLTDHWFATEVYSDAHLPDEYLKHRFTPYVDDDEALQFDERPLYREVIRGGAFPFMCGAYLVEARANAEDAPCPVDFAAITAYRDPAKRFATVIRNDGTARKIPLHPDGRIGVARILSAHEDLERMGVSVVPLCMEDGMLIMPRLDLPTLCEYWAKQLTDGTFDENEMFRLFDKIHDAIYRAAANGRCYWEMVPANCFYDTSTDKLIFFDQEYYWENAPPDAAVARAIMGIVASPALRADPRSERWRHNLFERYGLRDDGEALMAAVAKDTHMAVFGEGTAVLRTITAQAMERTGPVRFLPVAGILRKKGFTHPIIYGYGRRGRGLAQTLRRAGMDVVAIVDRQFVSARPFTNAYAAVSEALAAHTETDVLIISILDSEAIEKCLREQVHLPIHTLEALLHEHLE